MTEIAVNAMPRVLVLTSGHEVIEPGESLIAGKIYNSNRAMICGLLEDLGFHKITHYHVSDAPEELDSEINLCYSSVKMPILSLALAVYQ